MCAKNNSVHVDLLLLFTAHTRIRSKLVILLYLYTHWKAFHIIIIIWTSSLSVHFSFFISLSLFFSLSSVYVYTTTVYLSYAQARLFWIYLFILRP